MDNEGLKSLVEDLKNGFIKKERELTDSPLAKYSVFGAIGNKIFYYSPALPYFERNEVCLMLLHEEYHCSHILLGISERLATRDAKKKIILFDKTINLIELADSFYKHSMEYQKTLQKLTRFQKLKIRFGGYEEP